MPQMREDRDAPDSIQRRDRLRSADICRLPALAVSAVHARRLLAEDLFGQERVMTKTNPFAEGNSEVAVDDFLADMGRERAPKAEPKIDAPWEPKGALIQKAGAYSDIDIELYHRTEICPSPSLSPTGAKRMTGRGTKGCTPRHYWEDSPLNPNRRQHEDTDALRFGRALHDALLLSDRWQKPGYYHVLPEGFNRAASVKQAIAIDEANEAQEAGMTLIGADDAILINAMVAEVRKNRVANLLLSNGEPEVTLAAPDPKLGVWRRCRPDWLPHKKRVLMDVKTAADASYEGFSRAIKERRYDLAAAMQFDVVDQLFGPDPERVFQHLVIEKPTKWQPGAYIPVALWTLPAEDVQRGKHLYRRAMNTFSECLARGVEAEHWPGYADTPAPCGLPGYEARLIDEGVDFNGVEYSQK